MAKCKSCGAEAPRLSNTSNAETSDLCPKCLEKKGKELLQRGVTGMAKTIGGLFKK